jgi:hypothetical protein
VPYPGNQRKPDRFPGAKTVVRGFESAKCRERARTPGKDGGKSERRREKFGFPGRGGFSKRTEPVKFVEGLRARLGVYRSLLRVSSPGKGGPKMAFLRWETRALLIDRDEAAPEGF